MTNTGTVWTAICTDGCWLKFEHGPDESAALAYAEYEFGGIARVERENGAAQAACDIKPANLMQYKRLVVHALGAHGSAGVIFSDESETVAMSFKYGVGADDCATELIGRADSFRAIPA